MSPVEPGQKGFQGAKRGIMMNGCEKPGVYATRYLSHVWPKLKDACGRTEGQGVEDRGRANI